MSWFHNKEAERQAERDFERRGRPDRQLYDDHWSERARAYREQYDHLQYEQERREHAERLECERRARERMEEEEERIREAQHEAWLREQEALSQPEPEPEPDSDPLIEAMNQAITEHQQSLADNAP